jgi:hypothetical protein
MRHCWKDNCRLLIFDQDIPGGEQQRKKPYSMGKHGQASGSWQRVAYAGYDLWRLRVAARTDRRRRRWKKEEKDDDDDDGC